MKAIIIIQKVNAFSLSMDATMMGHKDNKSNLQPQLNGARGNKNHESFPQLVVKFVFIGGAVRFVKDSEDLEDLEQELMGVILRNRVKHSEDLPQDIQGGYLLWEV